MRCFGLRSSKIDVSTFEDRCVDFRRSVFEDRCVDLRISMYRLSKFDVSTFEDRHVDLRKSMCRLSKMDVSTFEDWCVDFRIWMIDMPTFEDRWSMCRPSKTDDRMWNLYVATLAQNIDASCMRIAPSVCTSVLSLF